MNGVDLKQYDAHLQKVEDEVVQVEKSILKKTLTSNKAIVLQTIALIVTLVGLAIAAERRITTIEVKTAIETQARVDQDRAMLEAIQRLQDQTKMLSENQVKVVTLLDSIDKRHYLEDERRAIAAKKQ